MLSSFFCLDAPNRFNLSLGLAISAMFFLIAAVSTAADNPLGETFENDPNQPWHIAADQLTSDETNEQYIGRGNVVVTKQGRKLTADFVRFDRKTMDIFAAGNVVLQVGGDILRGSRMEINLDSENGTIYDGTLFIEKSNFFISGGTLQKIGEKTYAADEATLTTCDGETPDWKITGKNVKITMEGYGVADHATLWARKMPVLYTPYMVFPMEKERQTGFLFPEIGFGDRKGFEYNQPFFWAIDKNSDATFYAHYMEERGIKVGAEYRYVLDDYSQGAVMMDYLNDDKVDDGSSENSQWGVGDGSATRPNSDRYWFRMKHDQELPYGIQAKIDLDVVSDQDYLYEFQDGYAGFNKTDQYFLKHFGRDLDDYDDAVRVNRLNLNKRWSKFSLNAEVRWYDDVINRRLDNPNTMLQKLPFVEFNATKQQLFDTPFYVDLDSAYVNYYREDEEKAQRIDVYPRIYLPINVKHYFSIEPSFGVRETFWYEEEEQDATANGDSTEFRHLYDAAADLSSEFYRTFRVDGEHLKAVRHSLRPRVRYQYIPDVDQSDLPSYDSVDRISDINRVTYSLTQILTSKSTVSRGPQHAEKFQPRDGDSDDTQYTYREFLWFKIQQSYDFDEDTDDEPFSPIYAELNLAPFNYLSLKGDLTRSVYDNHFLSHNVAVNLNDNRGDRLFVEYRYSRNSSESLYTDLRVQVTNKLSATAIYEKNLFDDDLLKTGVGMTYRTGCWSFNFSYTKEQSDRKIAFMIELFGLGEYGQSFDLSPSIDPVEYN